MKLNGKINKRLIIWPLIVLVAAAILLVWENVFNKTSEECRPVRDFLEFNQAQTQEIEDHEQQSGTDADIAEYQQWADGLAERAGKVTDPALASRAVHTADLASRFVRNLPQLRAASASDPEPGQDPPPIVYEMYAVNAQITDEINDLSKACPH
ncbi:hypothetical protein H7J77_17920 [Mycolicibacillus parakoreensis]|uniref:Uncharacterized protein n=1 Tax=Mycolicibacillus parakoreensis TaxID=1069221 RepID=A0ABY3U1W1_9MYCO|nr:hypothetical protein [Mycolicibacillus parakoreensis]MCV7317414.1 hypothetical protein [Mycolicibacillus parakoreensis]ULN53963.1 hypothetical protein MIU77_06640 [Mycolicibacillus parakoreensis]HLR99597.1 hypothetical protein [Mycolicibacillus parakoreensis]